VLTALKISLIKRMGALLAVTFLAPNLRAQPSQGDAVRFEYRAPNQVDSSVDPRRACPDADAFENRVAARTARARKAEPGELARTFAVDVRVDAGGASARLSFVDSRGTPVVRAVRGETCDEVVSAIALVTALAIEAGTVEPETPAPTSPEPARAAPPPANPAAEKPKKRAPPVPTPDALAWLVGIEAGVTTWLGPSPTLGLGAFGELGKYAGASARVTFLRATSHVLVPAEDEAYRRADFTALMGRIEGCPLAVALGTGFRIVPCLGLGLGALEGKGDPDTLTLPDTQTKFFADLVPALRIDWTLADSLLFFVEGELGIPLRHHDFIFKPNQPVFSVPALGVGASLGMALRFE
jgi:hypothetical protein